MNLNIELTTQGLSSEEIKALQETVSKLQGIREHENKPPLRYTLNFGDYAIGDYAIATFSDGTLEEACRPLIKYIQRHYDPYTEVVVTADFIKVKGNKLSIPVANIPDGQSQ